jgi:hypothetical protein
MPYTTMPYTLIGDSGTVIFTKTGTVTSEDATMSSKVTSNPIEGGGSITDHAVLDPIKFNISGVVISSAQYAMLETMWRNRDLLTYRGAEAFDNLLITSLQRTRSTDNAEGFGFRASFQQITITSAAFVDIKAPTMSQQNNNTRKSTKTTTQNGLMITSSEYVSYVASFNSTNVNTSVAAGRTNPSYAGYNKTGVTK